MIDKVEQKITELSTVYEAHTRLAEESAQELCYQLANSVENINIDIVDRHMTTLKKYLVSRNCIKAQLDCLELLDN